MAISATGAGQAAHRTGLLLVLSVVAGLLLAGLALPFVGGVGWAVKATNDALARLPTSLDEAPLAQHSLLLGADGQVIATLAGAEDRVVVPLTQVPAVMQAAIVAIEDNRFYEHRGVDVRGLLRAARSDANSGGYTQGASTITQQYVKNELLEQAGNNKSNQEAATEKSISRKLQEARYAIALEKKLTKAQILERYLNIAYFGEGVYGVGTAAEHYFQVPVNKLTLAQSAMLAGLVNNPSGFDPVAHPQASLARRNTVLDQIEKYNFLPASQVEAARRQPLVVHPRKRSVDPCTVSKAPFFCRYVLTQLLADPKLGKTSQARAKMLFEGGLSITTTWDSRAQAAVNATEAKALGNDSKAVAGIVMMEPGTGKVLAIGENRTYGVGRPGETTEVYPAIRGEQVGSTFKAITLATALEQGLPLSTTFRSPACYIPPFAITGKEAGARCPNGITNAGDSEAGTFNMVTATWQSVNTYFAQLELKAGIRNVAHMAQRLGIHSAGLDKVGSHDLSVTLGAVPGDLSVLDMATAYATIAAHGRECQPQTISTITDSKGRPVDFTAPEPCQQAVDPKIADTVTSLLQGVLTEPNATAAGQGLDRPAAGKTGTLDKSKGSWFVGYVPQVVTAVGVYQPKAPSDTLLPLCTKGYGCFSSHVYGGELAAPMWHDIMTRYLQGLPVASFALPPAQPPAPPAPPTPSDVPSSLPPFGTAASPTPSAIPPPAAPDKSHPPGKK